MRQIIIIMLIMLLTMTSCGNHPSDTENDSDADTLVEEETQNHEPPLPIIPEVKPMTDKYAPTEYESDAERSIHISYRGSENYTNSSAKPQLIRRECTGELIVADAVITNAPFNADPTGYYDSTTAIQNAINSVYNKGGGTVYIPAGKYLITSPLIIRPFVSVIGEYYDPDCDDMSKGYGTVFVADVESTENEMPALITVGGSAGIKGLTVYYPNQSADDVKPYPYTFYIPGHGTGGNPVNYMLMTIQDVTEINGYRGILASKYNGFVNEQFYIINFKGSFLECGLELYNCADASAVQDVHFNASYWANALDGYNRADEANIKTVTGDDAIAFVFSDVEWSSYSNLSADGYATGMNIIKGIRAEFNGAIYNLNLTNCKRGLNVENLDTRTGFGLGVIGGRIEGSEYAAVNSSGGNVRLTDVELVGEYNKRQVETINSGIDNYPEAGLNITPYITQPNLSVLDVDTTGLEDCSAELQIMLDDMAAKGGGIVYLPAGYYNVSSPVTIPEGVDLRGAGSLPMRDEFDYSLGTVVFSQYGKKIENADTAQALFTLEKNTSVRNIRILYNHTNVLEDYNNNNKNFTNYPFMIRGVGENASAINIALLSPVYGIEMKGADHYNIAFITTGAYDEAVRITDSKDGYIGFMLNNVTTNLRHAFWKSPHYAELFPNGWEPNPEDEMDRQSVFFMAMDNLQQIHMINSTGRIEHVFSYSAQNTIYAENSMAVAVCIGRDCWWRYEVGESNAVIVCNKESDIKAYGIQRFNGVTYTTDGTSKLLTVGRVVIGQREPNELVDRDNTEKLK